MATEAGSEAAETQVPSSETQAGQSWQAYSQSGWWGNHAGNQAGPWRWQPDTYELGFLCGNQLERDWLWRLVVAVAFILGKRQLAASCTGA